MEWNYEGFIDEYGVPVFTTPNIDVFAPDNELIDVGVIDNWQNEADGLKDDQDALNEFYRQFPRTTKHAFRDESKSSLFNLTKIYQQIDFNEDSNNRSVVTQGNFLWDHGIKDSRVVFAPNNLSLIHI